MRITVEAEIDVSVKKAWDCWTNPIHTIHWNFASDDWSCPKATNDSIPGGKFKWRMEAKDSSIGFDFTGTFSKIVENELISYGISDGRKVDILFIENNNKATLTESIETEDTNPDDQQKTG